MPSTGIINSIYSLGGGLILRVPRNHPAHVAQIRVESVAIPQARRAGVRTPGIVAFDERCDIVPVPYLIVEHVAGRDLETLGIYAPSGAKAWKEVGRDLALLHVTADPDVLPASPNEGFGDPLELVEERATDGWISPLEARWLSDWLEHLAGLTEVPQARRLVHGDVQLSNVFADPTTTEYVALLDWGCASGDDCVSDFLSMPMRAVPHILDGYRRVAPLDSDEIAEARIVWRRLQLALGAMPRGAAPGLAWGERPVGWMIDLLRFFIDPPNLRWRGLMAPRELHA